MKCPCHSGKPYTECCKLYHDGIEYPPNALALMRSRYSAYALGKTDYIIATTHPDHPDTQIPLPERVRHIQHFCTHTTFKGLEILEIEDFPEYSTVTFKAILFQDGKDVSFTEKSLFKHIDGRWFYHSALSHEPDQNN